MNTLIALLRGINVGGNNKLPMKELTTLLTGLELYNWETLERLKAPNERYQLIDKVFYLHAPDGIGRSKLAEAIGKGWGDNITARNWRTVTTIMAMAAELEEK